MNDREDAWLARPGSIRILWMVFIGILALTVVGGFFVHHHERFGIEDSFAFHAWYGFMTCVGMVVFAKVLGIFLKRPEAYYESGSREAEDV